MAASQSTQTTPRLRLRAEDADDLSVIAACLQDALIPLKEMAFVKGENRFMAAFTRFRRECLADPERCQGLMQIHSALVFDHVVAVRYRGLDPNFGSVRQELLTMIAEPAGDGAQTITLVFAGDAAIQLSVERIHARLDDFGEPWKASCTPAHDFEPRFEPALAEDG